MAREGNQSCRQIDGAGPNFMSCSFKQVSNPRPYHLDTVIAFSLRDFGSSSARAAECDLSAPNQEPISGVLRKNQTWMIHRSIQGHSDKLNSALLQVLHQSGPKEAGRLDLVCRGSRRSYLRVSSGCPAFGARRQPLYSNSRRRPRDHAPQASQHPTTPDTRTSRGNSWS